MAKLVTISPAYRDSHLIDGMTIFKRKESMNDSQVSMVDYHSKYLFHKRHSKSLVCP